MAIGRDYSVEAKQKAVRIIRRAYELGVVVIRY